MTSQMRSQKTELSMPLHFECLAIWYAVIWKSLNAWVVGVGTFVICSACILTNAPSPIPSATFVLPKKPKIESVEVARPSLLERWLIYPQNKCAWYCLVLCGDCVCSVNAIRNDLLLNAYHLSIGGSHNTQTTNICGGHPPPRPPNKSAW